MIVNAVRFFRCAVIRYFLFTGVNTHIMSHFYFKRPIPTIIAANHQKNPFIHDPCPGTQSKESIFRSGSKNF
jgi:hypothetical protein